MSETGELIVKFKSGVSEDDARNTAAGAGATVRRRMRTDGPDEVMLLLRVPEGALDKVEKAMKAHAQVELTERNQGGFVLR